MIYWQVLGAILSAYFIRWLLIAAVQTYYPLYLQWRDTSNPIEKSFGLFRRPSHWIALIISIYGLTDILIRIFR